MRRVISIWLPSWATDRLHRSSDAYPRDRPLVTWLHDGRRRVLGAVNAPAQALGLAAGMTLAHAQSLIPDLSVAPADLVGDAASLAELAAWCLRFSPFTAADSPDGIWIDATGCAHLRGGERRLLANILGRFAAVGIAARAAMAETPGAAWGMARHGSPSTILAHGMEQEAISGLPVAALRLPAEMQAALIRLGFERVGPLLAAPRAPLALRFGAVLTRRLDQATGRVFEPLAPVFPPEIVAERLAFLEPLVTAEAFVAVIGRLVASVCAALERRGLGARQLDLVFERVDGTHQIVRIGTASPARDAMHLARLLEERVDQVDPGLGVDAMRLVVTLADAHGFTQAPASLLAGRDVDPDIARLVDRLVNRLGADRVYRLDPVESDVPERSLRRISPMARPGRLHPVAGPRPSRLLTPPQPVVAMSAMPDQPPAMFVWRRMQHRIRRADGPERIHAEWWKSDAERSASRDYWQVEDQDGRRFWLFRKGDGMDAETGDLSWYLHGFF